MNKLFDLEKLIHFSSRNCLIHRENEQTETLHNYKELVEEARSFLGYLKKIGVTESRVCVQLAHSPLLCVVILSLLNGDYSFCPISCNIKEDGIIESMKLYRTPFLISNNTQLTSKNSSLKLLGTRKVFAMECSLFALLYTDDWLGKLPNEVYSIRTSGSTGEPKTVRVTYQCITPNINALSDVLEITPNDVVLLSSPPTFDPFVVEFFLAIKNGAELLLTNPENSLHAHALADIVVPTNVRGATIVQLTPSRFRLFGLDRIQNHILSASTSIRVLLLGGEPFPPAEEVKNWFSKNNSRTKLYNIYGITEVSCWGSLHYVDPSLEKTIPIGKPIDLETQIRVVNKMNNPIQDGYGIIQIGSSSRKCLINGESEDDLRGTNVVFRSTGDIGYIKNGEIFCRGRTNEMVKRRGYRVHLGSIEKKIRRVKGVHNVCCLLRNMKLVCFIAAEPSTNHRIQEDILLELSDFEKPDDIEFVKEIPLTENGKVSKKRLLSLVEQSAETTSSSVFKRFTSNVLGLDPNQCLPLRSNESKRSKMSYDLTFVGAGGTSFQALSLSTEIESLLQRSEPTLLQMMLDGDTTLSRLLDYINKLEQMPRKCAFSKISNKVSGKHLKVAWQFDTGKCVDSNPTCNGETVCVGSHSRLLITLDCISGREISRCILEDRIECQVSFVDKQSVLVGCYDGRLYRINILSGAIDWVFNCGGMIKARPLLNGKQVIVGSYSQDGNLICLDLDERKKMWRTRVGSKGIFASPITLNSMSLLACSLSGQVKCLLYATGETVWETNFKSPIFSTPSKLSERAVVVAEVSGMVHCIDACTGLQLWSHQTGGNIFSSVTVHNEADNTFILFGNHDHNIYCMKLYQGQEQPILSWKNNLDSAVYSTPVILHWFDDMFVVVSCSTKGGVYVLDLFTGSILSMVSLGNEIFSSPSVNKNKLYVGCRNNNLVCLELMV